MTPTPQTPTPVKPVAPQSPVTPPTTALRAAPPAPTPSPGTPYAPGVNTYATNPHSDLRGQTIVPGQMADRNQIAQNQINTWNASTTPQLAADARTIASNAAGAGQLGSGQYRTSLGNLAYNRDLQRNSAQSNYLNAAQTGSIEDAYRNIGIAQQQQGRQDAAQGQTFNEGLQSLLAGNSGNPSDTQLALSGIYSNNANQANQGLSSLIGGSVANTTAQDQLRQILSQYGIAGATPPLPNGTPITSDPIYYGGATG